MKYFEKSFWASALFAFILGVFGQAYAQQNLIGTVTGIDSAASKITVKTDAGPSVTFTTGAATVVKRVRPGQTSLASADAIKLGDIKSGDRVLVPGGAGDGQAAVKQVVVMPSEAIAAQRDQQRTEWQTRGVAGRISAIDQSKKEITVQARGRGAQQAVTVRQGPAVKILRYAPDSLRSEDARPGTFADLRVGDQIRVLGDRNTDGTVVTAEEIVSGTVIRTFGTITNVNASANQVTIKNEQTGQTSIITISKNSVVKRLPPEVAQNLAQRREQRQQQREARSESTGVQTDPATRRRQRPAGDATGQRRGGFQQLLEAQPAITITDLKVGDALLVTGTQSSDASLVTAINAISGDASAMQLLQRPNGRRQRNMGTGLPGGTAGGNAPIDDEP